MEIHECGSCAGVSLRSNWENFTIHNINELEANSYMAACVAAYKSMYVNLRRQNVSLELITGNIDKEPSYFNLGRKNTFFITLRYIPLLSLTPGPPNNLNNRLSKFLCTEISFSLLHTQTHRSFRSDFLHAVLLLIY